MPSLRPSSNGRGTACRPIRGRGSFRPAGSRRSTPCAAAPGSMPRLAELAERLESQRP